MKQTCISIISQSLVSFGRWAYDRNLVPATSGNFSHKLDNESFLVTVSGKHKGKLTEQDFMKVNRAGESLDPQLRPSAETLLHSMIYAYDCNVQCVLHTHSVAASVLSRRYQTQGGLLLKDYELLKALPGITTHQVEVSLPIVPNSQDMKEIQHSMQPHLNGDQPCYGFLIAGHGLYTWGESFDAAVRHIECLETLLECELKTQA